MFNRFCLSTGLAILGLMATSLTALGATTNGTVTFQDDTSATAPVDPTSPNVPLTTTDPNNPATNNTGTLTLDVAPKLSTLVPSLRPTQPKLTLQLATTINIYKSRTNAPLPTAGKSTLSKTGR